jgi:Tfp pilus assembly protein FimV
MSMYSGIQAAYLVKRFEDGKSHHQTKAKLLEAEEVIKQKDSELEKLKSQVRAAAATTRHTLWPRVTQAQLSSARGEGAGGAVLSPTPDGMRR